MSAENWRDGKSATVFPPIKYVYSEICLRCLPHVCLKFFFRVFLLMCTYTYFFIPTPPKQVRPGSGTERVPVQSEQGLRGLFGDGILLHTDERDAVRVLEDLLRAYFPAAPDDQNRGKRGYGGIRCGFNQLPCVVLAVEKLFWQFANFTQNNLSVNIIAIDICRYTVPNGVPTFKPIGIKLTEL